ncbi:hypothetical protein ASG29_06050 [Sphingomonas sp. Leaf412]|uniref:type II toxin-antitoxin system PemK/MazF family toxin n=1 Tax=Sphingomonas sp. Leaf412 TaxID=1736370 RepID=UPI0006FC10AC|nr:type II toxin-antitoxin system PemK/MazF family toxin [Sphingomonas sp. Leaf412]KQT33589.1 hypothetical protein ASG29_06050 [Sphingomonas sp. Leaf412]
MTRGDIVLVRSTRGAATKARPCVVVQRDSAGALPKLTVCPMTSQVDQENDLRPVVVPSQANGLIQVSQIEIDWILTEDLRYFGRRIGTVEPTVLAAIDTALRRWLDL